MFDIAGLTPVGVRCLESDTRLQWRVENRIVETGFERFLPVQVRQLPQSRDLRVIWRDFADLPLLDIFFKGAVDRALALPQKSEIFETDWEVLESIARNAETLPISGAIFHMARTGSTLIHRLLSKTGTVHSISENLLIDRVLLLTDKWPRPNRDAVLKTLLRVIGRPRRPSDTHFVLKMTDAVPNIRLSHVTSALPDMPWIFVYREPVEIMVSMLRTPSGTLGQWFRNRTLTAHELDMPSLADGGMWPEEFLARTLRQYCAKAIEAAKAAKKGRFLAVPYSRLPDAIWESIAPHFGISLTDKQLEAMKAEARFSAKRSDSSAFEPDSARKLEEASPRVRKLAERMVMPAIEQLRRLPQG